MQRRVAAMSHKREDCRCTYTYYTTTISTVDSQPAHKAANMTERTEGSTNESERARRLRSASMQRQSWPLRSRYQKRLRMV